MKQPCRKPPEWILDSKPRISRHCSSRDIHRLLGLNQLRFGRIEFGISAGQISARPQLRIDQRLSPNGPALESDRLLLARLARFARSRAKSETPRRLRLRYRIECASPLIAARFSRSLSGFNERMPSPKIERLPGNQNADRTAPDVSSVVCAQYRPGHVRDHGLRKQKSEYVVPGRPIELAHRI